MVVSFLFHSVGTAQYGSAPVILLTFNYLMLFTG